MFYRTIKFFIMFILVSQISIAHFSFAKEVSFTQDDRDRLIRVEEGLRAVNQRIDDVNNNLGKRIDDVMNLLYVVIGGMIALVGFVLWDRRTALLLCPLESILGFNVNIGHLPLSLSSLILACASLCAKA